MLNRIIISYLYSSRSRRHNVNLHAMCNAAHRLTIIITPSHTISQMQALSGSLMYKYTNYPVLMSYNNDDIVYCCFFQGAIVDFMKSRINYTFNIMHALKCQTTRQFILLMSYGCVVIYLPAPSTSIVATYTHQPTQCRIVSTG